MEWRRGRSGASKQGVEAGAESRSCKETEEREWERLESSYELRRVAHPNTANAALLRHDP